MDVIDLPPDVLAYLPADPAACAAWLADAARQKATRAAVCRKARAAKTPRRAAASRANGARGGRPRKRPPAPRAGEACCAACAHDPRCPGPHCERECLSRPARPCPAHACGQYEEGDTGA
jgi:hypothetical protein